MSMPPNLPPVPRRNDQPTFVAASVHGEVHNAAGLHPQGCGFPKNLACAAAVAGCVATPNPIACIMGVAPHCADCL